MSSRAMTCQRSTGPARRNTESGVRVSGPARASGPGRGDRAVHPSASAATAASKGMRTPLRLGRMQQQDLLDGPEPVAELERREVVDLVIPAYQGAHRAGAAAGPAGTDVYLGLPDQPNLVDVRHGHADQAVGLPDDERIPVEAHEPDIPDVALVIERYLPAIVLGQRGLGEREQERERAADQSDHGRPLG